MFVPHGSVTELRILKNFIIMGKFIKSILIIILIILTFLIFNEPGPVWFFALFLIFYLSRKSIRKIINLLIHKLAVKYFLTGIVGGLFIEFLAILSSMKLPPAQRALFHPDPIPDLILGVGYYTALTLGGYFIVKRYKFSLIQFFLLGGIFGLIGEEHGGVLLQLLAGNILGGIYVFLSYASFIALPYMLFNEKFNKFIRKKSRILKYPVGLLILAFFYVLFLLYYLLINLILSS